MTAFTFVFIHPVLSEEISKKKNENVNGITYLPVPSSVKMSGLSPTTAQHRPVSGQVQLVRNSARSAPHVTAPVSSRSVKAARTTTKYRIIKRAEPTHFTTLHAPHQRNIFSADHDQLGMQFTYIQSTGEGKEKRCGQNSGQHAKLCFVNLPDRAVPSEVSK